MVKRIINNCDVAKEVFVVLSYFDNQFIEKIPKDVLLEITDMASESNKEIYVEANKSLNEQNISLDCKEAIGILYFLFVMDDLQRVDTIKVWLENEKEFKIFDDV